MTSIRYAKFVNNNLQYAPRTITIGQTHYNPAPESWLADNGYLPVVETPYPDDGKYYAGSWVERDGQIVRMWTEAEGPEATATDTEVLNAMIGVSENG